MATLSSAALVELQMKYEKIELGEYVAGSLLRYCEELNICNEDGLSLSYEESEPLTFVKTEFRGKRKRSMFRRFFHIRRVLLSLINFLEGVGKCVQFDILLMLQIKNLGSFLTSTGLGEFLCNNISKESNVSKILTVIISDFLDIAQKDFKDKIGSDVLVEKVANSHEITVILASDRYIIKHFVKEHCLINRFILNCEFSTSILHQNTKVLENSIFKIIDLRYNLDFIGEKARETLETTFKPFMTTELISSINGRVIPYIMPLGISENDQKHLIEGEQVMGLFENVLYQHSQHDLTLSTNGKLVITNYKLVMASSEEFEVFSIPLTAIMKVTELSNCEVEFISKEFFIFKLKTLDTLYSPFMKLIERIFPIHPGQLFAPFYHSIRRKIEIEEKIVQDSSNTNGWKIFNLLEEFKRLNLEEFRWRLTKLNSSFQLCNSYPKQLVVPCNIEDDELFMGSHCRIGNRIPVLTWKHRNSSYLCLGGGLISRNSKVIAEVPKSFEDDEKILNAIIRNCADFGDGTLSPRSSGTNLITEAARSKTKKRLKRTKGLTSKDDISDFYVIELVQSSDVKGLNEELKNTEVITSTLSITLEPLLEMKESYEKLKRLCTQVNSSSLEEHWLTNLDATKWLEHLHSLMSAAHEIVQLMAVGSSILLSYGDSEFDRSYQVSSLAQLWMDPYYRTLKGFIVLIEKEWLSFGYPFQQRYGLLTLEDNDEIIPSFHQFLDCVWQTMQQFPYHFQFSNKVLLELAEHVHSCLYGTFVCNSEKERRETHIRAKTESFWSHILGDRSYLNPLYVGELEATIVPSYDPRALELWTSYYLRWYQEQELVSLPRHSSGICGEDILSMVNEYNMNNYESTVEFVDKLRLLKQTEKDLKQTIAFEKQKLDLLKGGHSLESAKEQILLRIQTKVSCSDNSPLHNSTGPTLRPNRKERRTRNSTPSGGLDLSQHETFDEIYRPKTARSSTDEKEEVYVSTHNPPRKKKRTSRRYQANIVNSPSNNKLN